MAKVEIKQPIVDEIKAKIDGAATVVLVDYRGLTVEQDTKLRKGLREAGCEYKVYKNTLMKRAFEGTDFAQLDDLLDGPSAIAISKEDATAPIRVLNNVFQTIDSNLFALVYNFTTAIIAFAGIAFCVLVGETGPHCLHYLVTYKVL